MKSKNLPSQKDAYYFSHDANARNDPKVLKLRRNLGAAGYGIYWMIIEFLREQGTYELPTDAIPDLAFDFRVDETEIDHIINDFDLFKIRDGRFYSERLKRSMEQFNEKKKRLSEAGRKGNEKRWNKLETGDAIARPSPPDPNPIALKKSKVKEINKSKVKESVAENVTLTHDEIENLKKDFGDAGYQWMIEKLNYSKGASGRTYKSDYMAIRKWVVDEYNKQHPGPSKTRFVA